MLYNELKGKIQLQGKLAIGNVMERTEKGKVFYLLLVADTKGVFGQNIINPSNLDEVENKDHIFQWKIYPAADPYPEYIDGSRWMDAITEEGENWHLFIETDIKLPEREGKLPEGNTLYFVEVPKEWYDEALQNQSA